MTVLNNLVAWYKGYDATDSTGSYNGVFRNSATSSQVGDTQCGSYWNFPAIGSTFEISPSTIPLNTTAGFTFSSWVYTPYSGSDNTYLLRGPNHYPWVIQGSTGNVFFLQDCFGLVNHNSGWSMTSAMNAGTWYHIAMTATGSATTHEATYYLNGTQVATVSLNTGVCQPVNFSAQYINNTTPSSANVPAFKRMTDVAFWDRALSPSEISTIASTCLINSTSSQTLVGQFASLVHDVGGQSSLSNAFASVVHDGPKESVISDVFATVAVELPPISASVPDITGTVGNLATFDGSASVRPEFYRWTWLSVPGGSTLSNLSIPMPDNGVNTYFNMTSNELLAHMDGDADDYSGNGRNGTVYGAGQVAGKVGTNAFFFNNPGGPGPDYIDFGPNLRYTTEDVTFALWVKPEPSQPNAYCSVFSCHQPGTTGTGYFMQQNASNTNQYTFVGNNGTSWGAITDTFNLTASVWSHVVFVRTGTRVRAYVNGVEAYDSPASSADPIGYGGSTPNFTIAGVTGQGAWNGAVDEFASWTRALSQSEIENLFFLQSGSCAFGASGSAGLGSTFSFTPDVAGTYQTSLNIYSGVSSSANAVISGAPAPPPFITGSSDDLLVASDYGLRYAEKASQQRFRRVSQIPFSLSSKSFMTIRKKSDDEF